MDAGTQTPVPQAPEPLPTKTAGAHRTPDPTPNGLPAWVTIVVVLTMTGLFAWNIIVNGSDGLANSYIIAGLLGLYSGTDQLLRRMRSGANQKENDQ